MGLSSPGLAVRGSPRPKKDFLRQHLADGRANMTIWKRRKEASQKSVDQFVKCMDIFGFHAQSCKIAASETNIKTEETLQKKRHNFFYIRLPKMGFKPKI